MGESIDRLEVQVEAQATKANRQLDNLINKLERVSSALTGVNASGLAGFANGISKIAGASAQLGNVKTADFTRLAKNLEKMAGVDQSSLNRTSASLNFMSQSLGKIRGASQSAVQISEIAKNISKLGNKSIQNAMENMPKFASSLNEMMATLSKSPTVSNNLIQMTNALANLASQGSKVGTAINSMGTTGSKGTSLISGWLGKLTLSTGKAMRSTRSFAQVAGSFYANFYVLIRGIKKIWQGVESSMDYIEEYNYFNVTAGKLASEWSVEWDKYGYESAEAYSESFEGRMSELIGKMSGFQINKDGTLSEIQNIGNLGLDVTELTNYSAGLMQVTNSLGLTGEASIATSQALTMLAGDISSFRNVDLKTAMTNLQSGLIGQSRALYKYGIDITNATLQTYAYKYGVEKAVSEMTQGEKMQLRTLAILDQSKVAWGDLAHTLQSPSNQLRLLQNNFKALARTIGNIFLPVVAKVLPYINGLVIAIRRLFEWVGNLLGVDLSEIIGNSSAGYTDAFDNLASDADDSADAISDTNKAAEKLKNTLLGFDEINQLNDNSSNNSSSGNSGNGGGNVDLTDALNAALLDYQSAWNTAFADMENKANDFADKIVNMFKSGDFEKIGGYISSGITKGLNKINWKTVYKAASGFGTGLAQFINGLITPKLFGNVGKTIAGTLNTAVYSALSFGNTFDFYEFGVSIATGINNFFDTFDFTALADTLNTWVDGLEDAIAGFLKTVKWSDILKKVGTFLSDLELDTVSVIIGSFLLKHKGRKLTENILHSSIGEILTGLAGKMKPITIGIGVGVSVSYIGFEFAEKIGESFYDWYNERYGTDYDTSILKDATLFSELNPKTSISFKLLKERPFIGLDVWKNLLPPIIHDVSDWIEENITKPTFGNLKKIFKKIKKEFTNFWNWLSDTPIGKLLNFEKIEDEYSGKGRKFTISPSIETDKKEFKKYSNSLYAGVSQEFAKLPSLKTTITSDSTKDANNMYSATNSIMKRLTFGVGLINDSTKDSNNMFAKTQKSLNALSPFSSSINNNSTKDAGSIKGKTQNALNKLFPFSSVVENDSQKDGLNIFNKTQSVFSKNIFHTSAKSDTSGNSIWNTIQSAFSINAFHTNAKSDTSGESIRNSLQDTFGLKSLIASVSLSVSGDKLREGLQTEFGQHALSASVTIPDGWAAFSKQWETNKRTLSAGIQMDVQAKADGKFLVPNSLTSVLIKGFANGGYPNTGELFMARENGINEMVGRIGSHSAVANNDQIVASIQGGVEAAMMNVMMAFAGNMGSGNSETPVIENVIKCDSETLYRSVRKGKDKYNRRYHVVTEF